MSKIKVPADCNWGEFEDIRLRAIERLRSIIDNPETKHRQLCIAIRELRQINAQQIQLIGQDGKTIDNSITIHITEDEQ